MIFRGFLLPAICTACDWTEETIFSRPNLEISTTGRSILSVFPMIVVSAVSIGAPALLVYAISTQSLALFLICLPIAPAVYLGLLALRTPQANDSIRPLNPNEHPIWSMRAMVIASLAVSLPFAAMHGAQTGYSWGPFVLLVGVSLVLCWARLSTRSLAASVFVHASYNFLLFSLMMLGTGGFRHLDRM
jgi:membrane protease YdiL (CAAX protease family)